jgi:xylulokinase
VDLGSTSIKAVVYDLEGRKVALASRPTERAHPHPDHPEWTVWPPERIWGGAAEALREALGTIDRPAAIRGVAVTGMGCDGLPIDREGRWLYPFISWLDPRTEPQRTWWLERIGAARQFSISGNQLWSAMSALRIRWLLENEPAVMARARRWLLIEDFLNFMLCGRAATDYSMASNTLLFDQRTRRWSKEILELSGIDPALLPEPLPSGTVLGEVTPRAAEVTGLPPGTPVVLGGHDYLTAALPAGAFERGTVLDVTGTWEIVVVALPKPVLTEEVLQSGIVVESHVARGAWSAMCASVAADALEWFRREFGADTKGAQGNEGGDEACGAGWHAVIEAARRSPPGARGVTFLPHLAGSTAPSVDPKSMGAFVGLRGFVGRDDLTRAVFEGLDYQFREILGALETGLGVRSERIVAVGGAVQNEFWMQNKADATGKPLEVPAIEEATPLGAAMLAGIGVGLYRDERDAFERVRKPSRVYEPDPLLRPTYEEGYERYRRVYPALRELHGEIFDGSAAS